MTEKNDGIESVASSPAAGLPFDDRPCQTDCCDNQRGRHIHEGTHEDHVGDGGWCIDCDVVIGEAGENRSSPAVGLDPIFTEHRKCGTPNGYDGCYAHYPIDHCRADGMAWPCDVERLRAASSPAAGRCDQIVNSGMGEPTECGRTLPCEYHRSSPAVGLDPERLRKAMARYGLGVLDEHRGTTARMIAAEYAALGESDR